MNNGMDQNNLNVSTKGYITYCPRCGAETYSNSRYCMKCGNLNPDHPENKSMLKFIDKKGGEGYSVGSGQSLVKQEATIFRTKAAVEEVGENTGSFNLCFTVNMVVYLVLSFGTMFYYFLLSRGNMGAFISSNLGDILFVLGIIFFYLYSFEILFMKMNKPWYFSFIPIYNFYLITDAVTGNEKLKKLSLIPVVGIFIWIYDLYKLGGCFKKSGLLIVLFPYIMIPLIAVGGSAFYGTYYTSKDNRMEDEFFLKRIFYFFVFFFLVLGVSFMVITNRVKLKSQTGKVDTAFIMNAATITVRGVAADVEDGKYTCDFDMDVFYFYFDDVSDYFHIPLAFTHAPLEAYVKVEKVKRNDIILVGKYNYYISMTDKENGFEEKLSRDLTVNDIKLYEKLSTDYNNGNQCYIHKNS